MQAKPPMHNFTGTYYLQGVTETASGILLKPDHSFEFFYSYGAVDRQGTGSWRADTRDSNKIVLNSRQRPARDFAMIDSGQSLGPVSIIQVSSKNQQLLSYLYVRAHTANGIIEKRADSHGTWTIPRQPIQKIELLFELCPDRFSTFDIADSTLSQFEFGLEPWIAEVFFHNIVLERAGNHLQGAHPLLDGQSFVYEKYSTQE